MPTWNSGNLEGLSLQNVWSVSPFICQSKRCAKLYRYLFVVMLVVEWRVSWRLKTHRGLNQSDIYDSALRYSYILKYILIYIENIEIHILQIHISQKTHFTDNNNDNNDNATLKQNRRFQNSLWLYMNPTLFLLTVIGYSIVIRYRLKVTE